MLLWSLDETALQLGGISKRTVQRLVANGELPIVQIGRLIRVPAEAVQTWIASKSQRVDNPARTEPKAWTRSNPCHTVVKIHPSGGSVSPMQAEKSLNDLLAQLSEEKRTQSRLNVSSKFIELKRGAKSQVAISTK